MSHQPCYLVYGYIKLQIDQLKKLAFLCVGGYSEKLLYFYYISSVAQ